MKVIKLFGFLILMGMAFSIPSYAGAGIGVNCTAEESKAHAAYVSAKRCATKVQAMRKSGVPNGVIEDRTGFCRDQDSASATANRDYARCRQEGLGMSPRGPRGPLDPRTADR